MKVGIPEIVEARISKDLKADLETSLKGRGVPKTERQIISELMKVQLSGGDDDFHIKQLNETEQLVAATGFTEWAWRVTPKSSGTRKLYLHVTLIIQTSSGEKKKDHPAEIREIVVQVNPAYSIKSFISEHWKWIVTVLILPTIGWVLKKYFLLPAR